MMNGFTPELAKRVVDMAASDPKFPGQFRDFSGTEGELIQLAANTAAACFSGQWRDHLSLDTRDRIVLEVQRAFQPADVAYDPLAESAQRAHDPFNPWTRHAEINDPQHVTTIGGAGFVNTVDSETGHGTVKIGGHT